MMGHTNIDIMAAQNKHGFVFSSVDEERAIVRRDECIRAGLEAKVSQRPTGFSWSPMGYFVIVSER
jgi:hypothetical protein